MGYAWDDKREYQFFEDMNTVAYTRKEKPVSEDEEDLWIAEKLNLVKSQGII
jgi:hypothetical protein